MFYWIRRRRWLKLHGQPAATAQPVTPGEATPPLLITG